jgi:AcrR family transcriptional regulator
MSETSPAKRPRGRPPLPREGQRQRLVEAAMRMFRRTNGEKLTVSDIVREAGMSSRTFYDHFDTKEDLFAEIFETSAARFLAELEEIARTARGFSEWAERSINAFLELFPKETTIDFEHLGGAAGQRVRAERRRYVRLITDGFLNELDRLRAEGRIATVPDRALVELIMTGIESLSIRYYSEGRLSELMKLKPVLYGVFLRLTNA